MTRPRILHAFKTALPETAGGILTVMDTIAEGLSHRFETEYLIASNSPEAFPTGQGRPRVTTVRHFGQFMSLPLAPTYPFRLAAMASSYDLIAIHAPFPLADVASYSRAFRRTPLVVHWHAEIVRQSRLRPLYEPPVRRTLEVARSIIISGEELVGPSAMLSPHRQKCVVVPFGVDVGFWNDLSASDRVEIDTIRAAHPRLVLAVGRLVSYKGFHVLIDAMRNVDGELWIAGTGSLKPFLDEVLRAAGVGDRVRFLGEIPIERLRQCYHAARVLAFPSITAAETFGIVQIEAMSCGLPIVNTSLPTVVPGVARDGIEALTVPPEQAAPLAVALNRILDDPALRDRLAAAARRRVESHFRQSDFLAGIESAYDAVLAGNGRRQRRTGVNAARD